jgi:transposase InsO family protein
VWDENFRVYGVRKVWQQLRREGFAVARCTVERLMQELDPQGAVRGKVKRTTVSDKAQPCPLDHLNRDFQPARPNALWLSDFTYVASRAAPTKRVTYRSWLGASRTKPAPRSQV